jgi:hypothetical protein
MAPKTFENLFLSIGAMKAGTTWLYAVLERHPELHFTPEKEIHYFYHRFVQEGILSEQNRLKRAHDRYLFRFDPNTANIDRIRHNLHWVADYLSRPVDDFWFRNLFKLQGKQRFACEFSNLTAHLPAEAWPHIESVTGNLRVLYTMRNPLKRLWSHVKFQLQMDGKTEHLATWTAEQFESFARQDHLWKNGEYGKVLRDLKAGLKSDNLKVMFYEDIHADQIASLRSIEAFLGIEPYTYPEHLLTRRFTESVKHPMPDFFPKLFESDFLRIRKEVEAEGFTVPGSWH